MWWQILYTLCENGTLEVIFLLNSSWKLSIFVESYSDLQKESIAHFLAFLANCLGDSQNLEVQMARWPATRSSTMLIAVTPELGNHPSSSWIVNWHLGISFWGLEVCFRCPIDISNSLNSSTNLYLWTLLRVVVHTHHYTNHNVKSDNVLYPFFAGNSSCCTSIGRPRCLTFLYWIVLVT